MENTLKFPLIPIRVYNEYYSLRKRTIQDNETLKSLLNGLVKDCTSTKGEIVILAKLILFDLKNFINHPSISKESSTAKGLENRLALLGDGKTADALPKKDPNIEVLLEKQEIDKISIEIQHKICSNFREKGDAIFYNSRLNLSFIKSRYYVC